MWFDYVFGDSVLILAAHGGAFAALRLLLILLGFVIWLL